MARMTVDPLTSAVARALREIPLNLLRFAKVAGCPQSTLSRIRNGDRKATPAVADAIASALERLGTTCGAAAKRIRRAQQSARERRTP